MAPTEVDPASEKEEPGTARPGCGGSSGDAAAAGGGSLSPSAEMAEGDGGAPEGPGTGRSSDEMSESAEGPWSDAAAMDP